MDKDEKDELGAGYSLDDFGLNFDENAGNLAQDSANQTNALNLQKTRKSHKDTHADSHLDSRIDSQDLHKSSAQGDESNDSHNYAPQFQGFDFSKAVYESNESSESSADLGTNFSVEISANTHQNIANSVITQDEKELLLAPIQARLDKKSEIIALFVAYLILFFVLLLFMPQVYLANNIYYASKNINYLKSQREALRDENGDLQQKLESLKFNFLTLEIEEIK